MSAFDGKEDTERLGSIWARSHPDDWQPPKTSRPIDPALQVDIRDERFVVFGLALEQSRGDKWSELQRSHHQSARGATSRHSVCVQRQGELKRGTVGYVCCGPQLATVGFDDRTAD